jgi:hypothetical protein
MLFFRDHFLFGSSFISPPCFPYHRSYRARPNDKTKLEKNKRKTGQAAPILPVYGETKTKKSLFE